MDYSKPPPKPPRNWKRIYFGLAIWLLLGLMGWAVGGARYYGGVPEHVAETRYHGTVHVPEQPPGRLADGAGMVFGAAATIGGIVTLAGTVLAHLFSRARRSE